MFSHWGIGEVLVILIAALLFFGPRRLPEIGKALGNGIREFRDSMNGSAQRATAEDASQPAPGAPASNDASRAAGVSGPQDSGRN